MTRLIACLLLVAATAHAQTPQAVFRSGVDAHVAAVRSGFTSPPPDAATSRVVREAQRDVAGVLAGSSDKTLDEENASAITKLASVAIKTDIEDTEAGVSIAPLAFFQGARPFARNTTLTIAALKDDKFRAGLSTAIPLRPETLTFPDLPVKACAFDEAAYREKLDDLSLDYRAVCDAVSTVAYPDGAEPDNMRWVRGAIACAREIPADVAAKWRSTTPLADVVSSNRQANLIAHVTAVIAFAVWARDKAPPQLGTCVMCMTPSIERLQKMQTAPTPTSCLSKEAIAQAVARARWEISTLTLGASVRGDFFPIKTGFNPDEANALPHGNIAETELRFELRHTRCRVSWNLGVGGKASREKVGDDLIGAVRPSASLSVVAARLDGGDVYEGTQLAVRDDGSLPPYLVLGLETTVGWTVHNKPASQESSFAEVAITGFVDFRVSSDIAFRIGIPVKAEIVTREANDKKDPPIVEKKALQWTVPVFLTTVLEI